MAYIIWIIVFLGVCTFTDFKERNVCVMWCVLNSVIGLGINLMTKNYSALNLFIGAAIGIGFILIAIITKQRIGTGDGLVVLTLGLIAGGIISFSILVWSFIMCSVISTAGIMACKLNINTSLPFMPFLLMGSVITFLLQGV